MLLTSHYTCNVTRYRHNRAAFHLLPYSPHHVDRFAPALACLLACAGAGAETASEAPSRLSGWTFGYSPYTLHYSDAKKENDWEPDDQKHSYVWLLQAEKALDERHIAGLAIFSNSFGQFTQYAYYGWQFRPFDSMPKFYAKITGGIIHGYKEPYEKKIPLNHKSGWASRQFPPSATK